MSNDKKIETLSMLIVAGSILSIIENIILTPILPVRIGLSNIILLYLIFYFSLKDIFIYVLGRLLLQGIFTGTILSLPFVFSAGGTFTAAITMYLIKKIFTNSDFILISIIGAIGSNFFQCLLFITISQISYNTDFSNTNFLLQIFFIWSIIAGAITGFVSKKLLCTV